ncbi:hypothetical protein [uncultured Desulfobacter sp.]|uniref:hypothetical protein n=1 Tax=uncultured Desulfobacter sp. TaxID=240139 RepID=UPI0029C633E7|nr:hypothetical protein [uncultured Desulfobacter sp.]
MPKIGSCCAGLLTWPAIFGTNPWRWVFVIQAAIAVIGWIGGLSTGTGLPGAGCRTSLRVMNGPWPIWA